MLVKINSLLVVLLIACLPAAAQFNFGGLFGKDTDPPDPKYGPITFWDPEQQQQRGIRALFYLPPQERENRSVDARLHDQMSAYLGYFCEHVFTLNSFNDPTRRQVVENILAQLMDEWEQQGTINPQTLFDGVPFLNVDVVILMERTHYNQVWKGDEKRLLIGMKVGAFELDFGRPLYNNRYLEDVPWFGERAVYLKAEKDALVDIADNIGAAFQQAANSINQAREAELASRLEEEMRRQDSLKERIEQERELYQQIVDQAEAFLNAHDEPQEIVDPLQEETGELKSMLIGYKPERDYKKKERLWQRTNDQGEVSPQEEAHMQELAQSIQQRMQNYDTWVRQQQEKAEEEQAQQQTALQEQQQKQPVIIFTPTPRQTPTPSPTPVLLPVLEVPGGSLLNRRWLIPTPTPTPVVSSEDLPARDSDNVGLLDDAGPRLSRPQPILQGESGSAPPPPAIPSSVLERFTNPQSATGTVQSASPGILSNTAATN